MLITNYDTSKIFIWNNRYKRFTLLNDSGAEKDFAPGTIMGRRHATGKVVPLVSTAADGSEVPIGILKSDVEDLADSGEIEVSICVFGEVAESKLVFDNGTDTLETVISNRRLGDRLMGDTAGVIVVPSTELTSDDNQ